MTVAKISPAQAASIRLARDNGTDSERKAVKKEIFAAIRANFSIPSTVKLKVEIDNRESPDFLVLKDSYGRAFPLGDCGRWGGNFTAAPSAVPQGPTKRWFKVPAAALQAFLVESATEQSFSDGLDEDRADDVIEVGDAVAFSGVAAVLDGAGNIYVELSEDQF